MLEKVFEAAKLAYANKRKEFITVWKLRSRDFLWNANSVLSKGKSAMPSLFNGLEVVSSASDKANLLAKNFSMNSNLEDSNICLRAFPFRTNIRLHNYSLTPKIVKKVIANFDLSKASGISEEQWAWTFIRTSWTL